MLGRPYVIFPTLRSVQQAEKSISTFGQSSEWWKTPFWAFSFGSKNQRLFPDLAAIFEKRQCGISSIRAPPPRVLKFESKLLEVKSE